MGTRYLSFVNIRKVPREMLMNGKSCLIPILQMDECLLINVIVLFVWIMTQPIRCFHHLDVTVGRQLRGIKAGTRWVFPVFFFLFFFYIQQTEATIFYTFTNIIIIILISLFLVIIIYFSFSICYIYLHLYVLNHKLVRMAHTLHSRQIFEVFI